MRVKMIPLMKNTFIHEYNTKKELSEFILKSDKLSMGEKCFEFEKEFAKYQGRKYAVLFNSGGSANLAMLQALKNLDILKAGDKIGFSSLTWSTNVMPIIQQGFEPIPIDVNIKTLNVMSENIIDRLKETPINALFITNALGFTGDLLKIKELCEDENILLLEDNCEALGTEVYGIKAGNFGVMSSFSFFVAHHMSTIEGGMVCTDNEELHQMLCIVRANGWDRNLSVNQQIKLRKKNNIESEFYAKYSFYDLGYNLRPTEITGFIGLLQLQYLEDNINKRLINHNYLESFVKNNDELITLEYEHISRLSPFAFPIICKNRELQEKYIYQFSGAGIEIRPMIAGNIQNQPFYKKYVNKSYRLEGAEFLHKNSFYCGNYPELQQSDLETISSCLIKY